MTEQEQLIADQEDLEAFARLPPAERRVTERLKGVLAETAVTGVIRYPWPLLQPVLGHMMQEQLAKYEADEHVEIGPARPILGPSDDSVASLVQRFDKLLGAFDSHPWTLQRLCELVLEPQKQYKRLHKLALAIEKLLLVTGELGVLQQPGPPPPLSQLTRVNEAPPAPPGQQGAAAAAAAAAAAGGAANRKGDSDGSGLVAAALNIGQHPQQAAAGAAAAAANATGDPASAAAAAGEAGPDPMQVDTAAAGAGADAAAAAATGGAAAVNGETAAAAMDTEPPTAAAAADPGGAEAPGQTAAAAADTEMATEEPPAVTDHSHTNAVGGAAQAPGAADDAVS